MVSSATGATQELELNIVAYPKGRANDVPDITFDQWLMGNDQTKLLGNHRIFVPCDSDIAIEAGEELFGEPKFMTSFLLNLPSPNPCRAPGEVYIPEWVQTWGFRVNDPKNANEAIFTTIADTTGLTALPAAISPITEYGIPNEKAIGCRWNILAAFRHVSAGRYRAGRARQADLRHQQAPHGHRECGNCWTAWMPMPFRPTCRPRWRSRAAPIT